MHSYHLTRANLKCPISAFFLVREVEIGSEVFYYIFKGDPQPSDGHLNLDDDRPGLGIELYESNLENFQIAA